MPNKMLLTKLSGPWPENTLLTYSNYIETFKIHTNASEFQLGAIVSDKGKPIDFYSRKLTYARQRYTITERELISIV